MTSVLQVKKVTLPIISDPSKLSKLQQKILAEIPKGSKGHHCYFCGQKFLKKKVLRKHIRLHVDKDFMCELCGKKYSTTTSLKSHMQQHREEPDKYKLRGIACCNRKTLKTHLDEHKSFGFKGPKGCEKGFPNNALIKKHIKSIHIAGNKYSKCITCFKRTRPYKNLECLACTSKSSFLEENKLIQLNNQSQQVLNEEPIGCNEEKCKFESQPVNENMARDICEICKKEFNSLIELYQHKIHEKHQQVFTCIHCKATYSSSLGMGKHLVSHPDLRGFVCQLCGKVFEHDLNLQQHMLDHKMFKPFKCKICPCAYKYFSSFKSHLVQTHNTLSPHLCKQCGCTFKTLQALTIHSQIHKEKLLSCRFCKEKFHYQHNLEHHHQAHINETSYVYKRYGKNIRFQLD